MFFPRGGRADRFTWLRTSLLFLAAGIWLAGVVTATSWITAVAIVILVAAILLRFLARMQKE